MNLDHIQSKQYKTLFPGYTEKVFKGKYFPKMLEDLAERLVNIVTLDNDTLVVVPSVNGGGERLYHYLKSFYSTAVRKAVVSEVLIANDITKQLNQKSDWITTDICTLNGDDCGQQIQKAAREKPFKKAVIFNTERNPIALDKKIKQFLWQQQLPDMAIEEVNISSMQSGAYRIGGERAITHTASLDKNKPQKISLEKSIYDVDAHDALNCVAMENPSFAELACTDGTFFSPIKNSIEKDEFHAGRLKLLWTWLQCEDRPPESSLYYPEFRKALAESFLCACEDKMNRQIVLGEILPALQEYQEKIVQFIEEIGQSMGKETHKMDGFYASFETGMHVSDSRFSGSI